ncbi:serine protease [Halogeometricum borinquense]|uniref:Serine protease n=1 Tax=Halogeometricum borinquense TaxID=60847 RepID=A0A482T7F9_9EURY|nr:serine protease [Halogeometricum borinquense]RYJ12757.1 serine protease [Halogeometricum borinquense]
MPHWGGVLDELRKRQQPVEESPHDSLRREYLSDLNEKTDRDVILYSSGWTHMNAQSGQFSISDSDTHGLMQVFYGLDGSELDLILHSPGGTPTAAESLVNYLRSKFDHLRIFVPHAAMSAATMICCAADELVMGRHSSLGPIDPQLTLNTPTGIRSVPAQAILEQFQQAKEEIKQDQDNLAQWTPIIRQYGPGLLVECEQAINLSHELAEQWSREYMFSGDPNAKAKADKLAETLSDFELFKSHGRHINRDKAREYGFNVTDLEDDQELQEIILSLYHATTLTHTQTGIAKIIENHNENAFIQSLRSGESDNNHGRGGSQSGMRNPTTQPPEGPPQRTEEEDN